MDQGKGRLADKVHDHPDPRRRGLLDQLPAKLAAYGRSLSSETDRVLVLLDLDNDNCVTLRRRLLTLLERTRPAPVAEFRFAIEETEAFYLGDSLGLKIAYPQADLSKLRGYRQDAVCGTWERFMEVVAAPVEDKTSWARAMSRTLTTAPESNRSNSFRKLCEALQRLCGEDTNPDF